MLQFDSYAHRTLCTSLLLIAGDIAINPGPIQTTCANNGHTRASLRQTSDNNPARKLSVLYANARSIVKKTTKLSLEMNAEQFDVVINPN